MLIPVKDDFLQPVSQEESSSNPNRRSSEAWLRSSPPVRRLNYQGYIPESSFSFCLTAEIISSHGRACMLHEGAPVLEGNKLVLRSDLMFSQPSPA